MMCLSLSGVFPGPQTLVGNPSQLGLFFNPALNTLVLTCKVSTVHALALFQDLVGDKIDEAPKK